MREQIKVTGMVLSAMSVGEYDKRVVLLTAERGKISGFVRGARRTGSMLMAGSRPFSFGVFTLYGKKDSYVISAMEINNYFAELAADIDGAYYGFYFMEVAGYLGTENANETEMLKLLYYSLKALINESLPNVLVRRIFELKMMVLNGEYAVEPPIKVVESTAYTIEFVAYSIIEKLYTFNLSKESLREFDECIHIFKSKYLKHKFRTHEILKIMSDENSILK